MKKRGIVRRLHGWTIRLFPEPFRRRYGAEMEAFFDEAYAAARGWRRPLVGARLLWGSIRHGIGERLASGSRGEGGTMTGWGRDVRLAVRGLRRRPGVALAVVATTALAIGAASSVFAVVDGVVFRPLPYPERDRLVAMWTTFEGQGDFGLSLAEQYDFAEESRAVELLGSYSLSESTLTGVGEVRRLSVAQSYGPLYEMIGARTVLGRLPGAEDARAGAPPVVVVSHDFWRTSLAADPDVIGRTLELDGSSVEIVGVMDPDVRLPTARPALWWPIAVDRSEITNRSGHFLEGIGRLAPGASMTTLRRELAQVHARWSEVWAGAHSPGHSGHALAVAELHDRHFGGLRETGVALLWAILLVLALACANVASLLVARGESRIGEVGLRRALGASRGRIVRQLLVESLVLASLGGILGVGLAVLGIDALLLLEPGTLPRTDEVGLDARVTGFAVAATLLAGLGFGVLPAWRTGSARAMGGRGSVGPDRVLSRSLATLVVGQVAVAVMLVAGAGLLTRSVQAMADEWTGIPTDSRLTFAVSLPAAGYADAAAVGGFWTRLLDDVRATPGVEDAAVVRLLPLRDPLRREGIRLAGGDPEEQDATVAYGVVSPGYFSLMATPILEGREFRATDEPDAPRVALVNEAAARAYWPGRSPVGERVRPLFMPADAGPVMIVGVVGNVRAEGVRGDVTPEFYLPYAQTLSNGLGYVRGGVVIARTSVEPATVVSGVRGVVEAIDPRIPVTDVATYEEVRSGASARERFFATVLAVFALLALVIAGLGTYGVVAFVVARRTREFGIRVALGAMRSRVVGSVLRRGLRVALLGVTVGVGGALALGPLLGSLLYGVEPRDAVSLTAGALLMATIVVVAAIVPAWRASRVDPVVAMRDDV